MFIFILACNGGVGSWIDDLTTVETETPEPESQFFAEVQGPGVVLEDYSRDVELFRQSNGVAVVCASEIERLDDSYYYGEVVCLRVDEMPLSIGTAAIDYDQRWGVTEKQNHFGGALEKAGEFLVVHVNRWPEGGDDGLAYLVPYDRILEYGSPDYLGTTVYLNASDEKEKLGRVLVHDFDGDRQADDLFVTSQGLGKGYFWYDLEDRQTYASLEADDVVDIGEGSYPGAHAAFNGVLLATGSGAYDDGDESLTILDEEARSGGDPMVIEGFAGLNVLALGDHQGAPMVANAADSGKLVVLDGRSGSYLDDIILPSYARDMARCSYNEHNVLLMGYPNLLQGEGGAYGYLVDSDDPTKSYPFFDWTVEGDEGCGADVSCVEAGDGLLMAMTCNGHTWIQTVDLSGLDN